MTNNITAKSAIECLKKHKEERRHDFIVLSSAVDKAIEALERQIPRKPVKKNPICYSRSKVGEELYAYDYHCPHCDTKVNSERHHCPCGQALDWRGE